MRPFLTLLFSFYSVCPQMFQVITPDITSFFFTKTLSFGGFSKENRPLLKRFLTGSVFYQGRAFLAFGLRHFYVNWAVNCARESYSTGLVADGFFFPYKTHCGYSFRPLGLFNIPPLGFNLIKSKPFSISRVKPYFLPHPSSPLNPTKQSPADHRIFTKIIGAIARRRRRRGWAVRWTPFVSKVRSSFFKHPPFISFSPSSAKTDGHQTFSWVLEAARFKPGLSTEWRRSRLAFNWAWGLNFYRQRRLTRFFLRLKGLGGFNFLQLITLSAGHILSASFIPFARGFLGVLSLATWACRLNGRLITNPFMQLFSGDTLQLLSLKSIPSLWALKLSVKKANAFLRGQFISSKVPPFPADVPFFLESDELTLTSVLLGIPALNLLLPYVQAGSAPYLTFRLYNWKYTT